MEQYALLDKWGSRSHWVLGEVVNHRPRLNRKQQKRTTHPTYSVHAHGNAPDNRSDTLPTSKMFNTRFVSKRIFRMNYLFRRVHATSY
jgi:hypothetical protein